MSCEGRSTDAYNSGTVLYGRFHAVYSAREVGSVFVVAAVIPRNGRVLIARRSTQQSLPGSWEFPGGKVEPSEAPEEALVREIAEELELDIRVERFLTSSHDLNDSSTIDLHAYLATVQAGQPRARVHSGIEWVAIEQLSLYRFAPADRDVVAFLQRERLQVLSEQDEK
jgi:mutator protein MutT